MIDDIVKPDRSPAPENTPASSGEDIQPIETPVVTESPQPPIAPVPRQPRWGRRIAISLAIALMAASIVAGVAWFWYKTQLQAVAPGSDEKVKVTVVPGTDPSGIAELLKENGLIRNEQAFLWYVRIEGVSGSLQSGVYRLAKADDTPSIVEHLTSGRTDTFSITFLPGNTLEKHREVLIDAGYDKEVVDAALQKEYTGALFSGKPKTADLEGYIYGETYNFAADATPEQILQRTFDEFQAVIEKNGLIAKYKKQGFSLYEGITFASIIQREERDPQNQRMVSQVFHLRLTKDMPLGSDPTYQYIADKQGVPRDPDINSPYNTRKVTGLPPGPIASPGESALVAVATPAEGDYLYFLSGDDDKLYFGRTFEEHEKNIREHCQKKCQIL